MPSKSESGGFLRKLEEGFRAAGIAPNHSIICAVSGGPDSTALVLGAIRLRNLFRTVVVSHFNHRARGAESDGDEEFVRQLCLDHDIPLHVGRAPRNSTELDENSARQDRYSFFVETAESIDADAIVVAHTIEDQAETVLMRIVRGAGIRGAGGMRNSRSITAPSGRDINLGRPMLDISRSQVSEFLNTTLVAARHDSSNDDWMKYARNRIRHRVMPQLKALNPNAVSAISRFAAILRSNVDLVEALADEAMQSASTEKPNTLIRRRIAVLHPIVQAEVLRRVFRSVADPNSQLDRDHVVRLLDLISQGKSSSYHLPGDVLFHSDHEHVSIYRRDDAKPDLVPYPEPLSDTRRLAIPGSIDIGDGFRIAASISATASDLADDSPYEAWLAPELADIGFLEIRNRASADRFNPLGMSQDVKLNDFLINSKIAASWRDRIPLVVSPKDGRIVWLPGIRPSDWAKLRPDHETALRLNMIHDRSMGKTVERSDR